MQYLTPEYNLIIPARDPQTGTACAYFWLIPMNSDNLRRTVSKCTSIRFVIKPRRTKTWPNDQIYQIAYFSPRAAESSGGSSAGLSGGATSGSHRPRGWGGGGGAYLRVVCLSHLTVGHALLSRRTWEGFFGSALHRA